VEVLKVAHHGSRTASTAPFLAAARPSIAIFSTGSGNPYGHPTAQAIRRQVSGAVSARSLRTDLGGPHLRATQAQAVRCLDRQRDRGRGVGRGRRGRRGRRVHRHRPCPARRRCHADPPVPCRP
jgi:hypothetical protein